MSYARNLARLARDGMPTVDTLQNLRDIVVYDGLYPPSISIAGHTVAGIGAGVFDLQTGFPGAFDEDDGVTVLPSGGDGSVAYVRRIDAVVCPQFYGARPGVDSTAQIQAAVDYVAALVAETYPTLSEQRPADIPLISFQGQTLGISGPIEQKNGCIFESGGLRALNDMTMMLFTTGYPSMAAGTEEGGLNIWHSGFLGEFSIEADGWRMTDGVCVGLGSTFFHIDDLSVIGVGPDGQRSDGAWHNEYDTGIHFIDVNLEGGDTEYRNYYADPLIKNLRVARWKVGVDFDAVDIVAGYVSASHCPDVGIVITRGVSIAFAHVWGCASRWAQEPSEHRGYALYNADNTAWRGSCKFELESSDYGLVFGGGNTAKGDISVYAHKNVSADIFAEQVSQAIETNITYSSGPFVTTGAYPSPYAIKVDTLAYFARSVITLNSTDRCVALRARWANIRGILKPKSGNLDGSQPGTELTTLDLDECSVELLTGSVPVEDVTDVNGEDDSTIVIRGENSRINITGTRLFSGISKINLGDDTTPLTACDVRLAGNLWGSEIANDGGNNTIHYATSTANSAHNVSAKVGSTKLYGDNELVRAEADISITASGDGVTTIFTGGPMYLLGTEYTVQATANTDHAIGPFIALWIGDRVQIRYTSPPPPGSDNLQWSVRVRAM